MSKTTAFLTDFSNSSVSPEAAVRFFYSGCPGRTEELDDITDNRATYTITSYKLGSPSVTIHFGGTCAFRSRTGDACISLSCEWNSTKKATGEKGVARGTCYLTSLYRDAKWQLCNSEFESASGFTTEFIH